MRFKILIVFLVLLVSISIFNGSVFGWSNLHWGSKDSSDLGTTSAHARWYGGTTCKKIESDFYKYVATQVGPKPMGGFYYYSTHDYILDLALYYLDMADDS